MLPQTVSLMMTFILFTNSDILQRYLIMPMRIIAFFFHRWTESTKPLTQCTIKKEGREMLPQTVSLMMTFILFTNSDILQRYLIMPMRILLSTAVLSYLTQYLLVSWLTLNHSHDMHGFPRKSLVGIKDHLQHTES